MSAPVKSPLDTPLASLGGVGTIRGEQLARLGLFTARELLNHVPARHEDRRHFSTIRALELGAAVTTRGTVVALGVKLFRKGTKSVFELILEDGSGRLHCRWWNLPFMEKYFKVGDDVFVFGKPINLKPRTMDHPETEVIEEGEESSVHINRIVPIYPLTEGLKQRWLRSLVWRVLHQCKALLVDPHPEIRIQEPLTRAGAFLMLHFPGERTDIETARRRLALDEFIDLQIAIQGRRKRLQANAVALACAGDNRLIKPFLAGLGFRLTEAQTRVLREIRHDLGGTQPMRRLLQGDVGSGKTVVAACAALMTLESGFDVLLMAPTEILAEQLHANFSRWFEPMGIRVEMRTGSRKTDAPGSATGKAKPRLFVGTHALLVEGFAVANPGLVIIDEQHKFGVAQRETLVRKGRYPHLLVMTATPIPRTLGLTLYGDLDVSVIDKLPRGRGVIRTYVRGTDTLPKVWQFIREKVGAGRQAYVVYPRVEDMDLRTGTKAVMAEFQRLEKAFAPSRVGMLHGRMKSEEKEAVMADFRANRIQVLLATLVIEVGVDVPNASVMVIENAEQFGLAQLHQLRGRIGRGAHDSYCILVAESKTEGAHARLQIMAETNDGFRVAEEDMRLRGPGELLGQAQSGIPPFRFGDLRRDLALIEKARTLVAGSRTAPVPGL